MSLRNLFPLAALLLACASEPAMRPARIEHLELDDWLEIRTPRFTLLSNAPAEQARAMARRLAAFAQVVESKAPNTRVVTVPAVVLLFRNYPEFLTFASPGIGGFMSPGLDENLLVSSCDGAAAATAYHEYVHLLMLGDLAFPAWYGEGFAELLGSMSIREDIAMLGVPPGRKHALARGPRVSVEELLGTRYSLDLGRRTPGFYAESWLVVHYLYLGPSYGAPSRLEQFRALLLLQNLGISWRPAFEQAFEGMSLEQFQREIDAHRERILDNADLPATDIPLGSLPELEESPVSKTQIAIRLGKLALRHGLPFAELARAFFLRALEAEPNNAAARIGLARSASLLGDIAAADEALALAERDTEAAGEVALARGEILLERHAASSEAEKASESGRARLTGARSALQQATERSPDLPAAWAALGRTYAEDAAIDPAPGIAALERARAAAGADPRVELDLGRLYARSGNAEGARILLSRVAVLALDEKLALEAQSALAQLAPR